MKIPPVLRRSRAAARFYLDLLRFGDRPMRLEAAPSASHVLVLAPHPDDETLGCGGVIRQYTQRGTPLTIIFVSDDPPGSKTVRAENDGNQSTRRLEALGAGAVLGVTDFIFLEQQDGKVSPNPDAVNRVQQVIERQKPDLIFLPFLIDQHPDHRATNALLLAAGEGLSYSPECWGYEVWTPLYANRIVDISDQADIKWQALRCYESQNARHDYVQSAAGLAAFRQRSAYQRSGFAEAFFAVPIREYRDLYVASLPYR